MDSEAENRISRPGMPPADAGDHQSQQFLMPGPETAGTNNAGLEARSDNARSAHNDEDRRLRPELLQINSAMHRAGSRSIARDFEQAVVDDDLDEKKSPGIQSNVGPDDLMAGRGATSPVVARRGTMIRGAQQERPGRSRASSNSSRSTSPPNSVDAFAEPRRRERAGTLGSRAGSDLELGLHRTISGGTHRRRPTFSDHPEILADSISQHGGSDKDDRFPLDEISKAYIIDFEALEEFVAENEKLRRQSHEDHPQGQHSQKPQNKQPRRIFHDLRPGKSVVPQIIRRPASPILKSNGHVANESDSVMVNEKNDSVIDLAPSDSSQVLPGQADLNRFSFFSSELDSTIHAADIGDLLMPGESFRDLFTLNPEGGVWWLDVMNPTEDEIKALGKAFSIHPLTSEDIRTQEAREKVELFRQYYFVCFRSFFQMDKKSEDYMDPVNVYVVVFREGAISFTFCQSPHADNVRRRISKLRDYVSLNLSSDWICYALIDDIVDSFGPVIRDIEEETDMIEDSVFVARPVDRTALLRQIGECRKKVMGLMRLIGGKADVIKGFAKRCNEQYSVAPRGEIGLYLGDIQDHVVTMMSSLGHFEKMLSRSHSNYLAQLQVDNIAQGTRANEVLSKITIVATILVPLNLICGLFGMNVPVPGADSEGLDWFFGILGIIFFIVVFSGCVLKKFKYF
ncbi:MAG: Mg(2+) transporter [Sclerophora amabilis]|nr:MAG: Mg(2+) transporter [Sclerophora amabilis]